MIHPFNGRDKVFQFMNKGVAGGTSLTISTKLQIDHRGQGVGFRGDRFDKICGLYCSRATKRKEMIGASSKSRLPCPVPVFKESGILEIAAFRRLDKHEVYRLFGELLPPNRLLMMGDIDTANGESSLIGIVQPENPRIQERNKDKADKNTRAKKRGRQTNDPFPGGIVYHHVLLLFNGH